MTMALTMTLAVCRPCGEINSAAVQNRRGLASELKTGTRLADSSDLLQLPLEICNFGSSQVTLSSVLRIQIILSAASLRTTGTYLAPMAALWRHKPITSTSIVITLQQQQQQTPPSLAPLSFLLKIFVNDKLTICVQYMFYS